MNKPDSMEKNKKGKILRVKIGYNPNSSSMGSIVYVLPVALLAATVGFGAISGIIMSAFIKQDKNKTQDDKNKSSDK